MSSPTRSPSAIRRALPVAVLALVALAQVTASAGVPVPGGGPPAPTLRILNNDNWINASEQSSIMVRATYNTSYLPPITSAHVKIVGTPKDTMTPCSSSAPYSTPLLTSSAPQPGGFFLVGPFNVSSFPDNVVLCAIGFVRAGAQQSATSTSNLAIKDTIPPVKGEVVMIENFIIDGILNNAEANEECCIAANWSHPDPSDVALTQVWFLDSANEIKPGCGKWDVAPSGFGAVNSTCANNMAQGVFRFWGQWFDAAGNGSIADRTPLIKDTIGPLLTLDTPDDGDQVGSSSSITVSGTGEPGSTVTICLDGDEIGTATVGPDGTWTFTFNGPSANGFYTLAAKATDGSGNTTTVSIVIEVTDLIPIIILPMEGASEDGTVTIYGRGRPASFVEVFEGDVLIGSVRVATDGFWTIITGMPDGPHAIRARGYDSTIASTFSPIRNFTVDAGRPTVTITTPVLGPSPLDIALLPGLVEGTATDGLDGVARIRLEYYNLLGTRVLAEDASCPTCGVGALSVTWEHEPVFDLPGLYTVVAQAFDLQGNSSIRRTIKLLQVP